MPYYCVNMNAQADSGDHEVHETSPNSCSHLPDSEKPEGTRLALELPWRGGQGKRILR